MSQDSHAARPFGRSLSDLGELSPAEQKLLDAVRFGNPARIAVARPEEKTADNCVRAGFIRFLALGGDTGAPVHERGILLQGAFVEDELDLQGVTTSVGLALVMCCFGSNLLLIDAVVKGSLIFYGSRLPRLVADRVSVSGGLFLRGGFFCGGGVRLSGANIIGDFDCSEGIFRCSDDIDSCAERISLNAEGINVGGIVWMADKFQSIGEVRLLGAKIAGNLVCDAGSFDNPDDASLTADRLTVGGLVSMQRGFRSSGELRMLDAKIRGNWQCAGGRFENPDKISVNAESVSVMGNVLMNDGCYSNGDVWLLGAKIDGYLTLDRGRFSSLTMSRIRVGGAFSLCEIEEEIQSIDFSFAQVGVLVDSAGAWSKKIVLDGFVYDSLGGVASVAGKDRIAWLERQSHVHRGDTNDASGFKPQPWIQARKVLREMGHYEAAREVGIAFEARKRRIGLIGGTSETVPRGCPKVVWPWLRRVYRVTAEKLHWGYGATVSYGYRPLKLLFIALLVWGVCTGLFYWGGAHGVFAPTDPLIYQNPAYAACVGHWTDCAVLNPAYTTFYAPVYSLNVLLPVGDLGQASSWAPMTNGWLGLAVQVAVWFETLFGWAAGLLLIAVVSGLVKRDE